MSVRAEEGFAHELSRLTWSLHEPAQRVDYPLRAMPQARIPRSLHLLAPTNAPPCGHMQAHADSEVHDASEYELRMH